MRRARIAILSAEADRQRDIAFGRLTSMTNKASLLLVGAGLIGGSWAIDLVTKPFGLVPALTVALAFAAGGAALVALFPSDASFFPREPELKLRALVEASFEPDAPDPTELSDLVLETKAVTVERLLEGYRARNRWLTTGYVLLGGAILGGVISVVLALTGG